MGRFGDLGICSDNQQPVGRQSIPVSDECHVRDKMTSLIYSTDEYFDLM